jgi:glycosyltransferase involved in cell wall biosynthesis
VLFEQRGFPKAVAQAGADLAHVPYWGSPLRCSVPVVVTIHDMTTQLIREYRRTPQARLYNALIGAAARGASHIITDSFSSKLDVIDELGIAEDDITAIYLGIGAEFSAEDNFLMDMALSQKYDLPEEFVLYLGGYELHKNVITLLNAFTYVVQSHGDIYPLLLAGKQPQKVSPQFPDYVAHIAELGLTDYVRWIGYVDEADKPAIYRHANTFVFPSRAEGFGFPPLEAMACGTPVVTTDAGSLPEVVGDAAFTVDPDDERDMAGAIIATLVQDNLAAELRTKGLERAKTFSWQTTAHETLLIYDDVLSNSRSD